MSKRRQGDPQFSPAFLCFFHRQFFFNINDYRIPPLHEQITRRFKKCAHIVFCPQCWPFWIFFRNSKGVGGGGRKIVNALNEMAAYTSNLILLTH